MARVLLAGELGNGDGPARRLLPLALALREAGHEPLLALSELARDEPALGAAGLPLVQAPAFRARVSGLPPVHTYTDILLRSGFVNVQGLRPLARGWRDLVRLLAPALLVLDHAPVALFATRDLGMPRLRYGDGFGCPPLATPMPPMSWWDDRPEPFDTIGERNVLHVANNVASELGLPAADTVATLLRGEDDALATVAELDVYPAREGAGMAYCGLLHAAVEGTATPLPEGDAPCCFVALRAQHPLLEPLVGALAASGQRALLQLAGASVELARTLTSERIAVARTPVPVSQVREACSHAVIDGQAAITQGLLLAGKPMLLLPTLLEHSMLAHRVQQLGAGLLLDSEGQSQPPQTPDLTTALRRLADEPAFAQAARAFAERHHEHDDASTLRAVLARAQRLLTR